MNEGVRGGRLPRAQIEHRLGGPAAEVPFGPAEAGQRAV
jgi:hypothetical protein